MSLYSDPPPLRPFSDDKPTLLVCWWITTFCAVIVLLRLAGRFVRTERLFREDKTAALALVPLILRMGVVHFVLVHGTNNVQLAGVALSDDELCKREIASGLVLLSRVLYAATLWLLKYAILEFFKRLNVSWERTYEVSLTFIRVVLTATFLAVVISDLAECHPFQHYWQVLPDPGGQCRQGYAQLLTMAVCNVLTDLLLVFFPVPIILTSSMSVKRKVQLVLLFSLSLAPVAVTIYRVPQIIRDAGSQQTRSLLASVELLFATAAANALVLGSFVRDRGVKKNKFKYGSIAAASIDRSSGSESRRPTIHRQWGSDEDLARDTGYGLKPELREDPGHPASPTAPRYTPAPMATIHDDMSLWQFPGGGANTKRASAARSDDPLLPSSDGRYPSTRSNSSATPRRVSFFDYGGLLDDQPGSRRASCMSASSGGGAPPPAVVPASGSGFRRGSAALLQDLGGLLGPLGVGSKQPVAAKPKTVSELEPIPQGRPETPAAPATPPAYPEEKEKVAETKEPELVDAGGLLK